MFLTGIPAKILACAFLALLLAESFKTSGRKASNQISVLMEPDGTGVWRDVIAAFNATHPGISAQLIEGPPATNTREDMYSTAFLGGKGGYDVVYCDVVWVPKFAAAGWLLDLTERLSAEDRADFLEADLDGGTYNGRLYRIPAFTDAGLLYYRSDLVSDPPQSFADFMAAATALRTPDRWGYVWQGKQYEGLITNYLEVLWGYGGDWITPDRRVLLDAPEALRALQFLKSTVGSISPPGVTAYMEEDSRNLFQSGRSVFLRNWFYVSGLVELSASQVKGRVGFVPMLHEPGERSAGSLGGWGFGISRYSENPDAAWEFVRFLTSRVPLQQVQERMGRVAARRSLVAPQFLDIVNSARPRPPIPEYAQASDILQRWLSAALAGSAEPAYALQSAARETRALLGSADGR